MIKNYDPNTLHATHTIRVTLMWNDYTGQFCFEMGGNCKGANILSTAICFFEDCYMDSVVDNDCLLDYDSDEDIYTAVLKNDNGETVEVSGGDRKMSDLIVCVEIDEVMPDA